MRLFLIDGSALAYRSHFSFIRNPLVNSAGFTTSAIFGFSSSLMRLLKKENPEHIAVVFDTAEDTFRHEAYAEYKATREKMPDDMADQLPYVQDVVEAMRIPYLTKPGFEADDIIGTLARAAEKKDIKTYIVSGDKDFLQLVGPKTFLYNMKKANETEILGKEGPVKKWGIPPEHVIDFLALMGDSSDNVPGVPGVGEKTAGKLVQKFGSLEQIYDRIDEVTPPKLKDKLIENRELAELSKELVTIDVNVSLPVTVESLKREPFDVPRLKELFEEFEFQSLLSELPKEEEGKKTKSDTGRKYQLVNTKKKLEALEKKLKKAKAFAVDTETTSLSSIDAKIVGVSFSFKKNEAYYVPVDQKELSRKQVLETLKPILEDESRNKGGQNIKYDRLVFRNEGIELRGVTFDTMLESYLLESGHRNHSLDKLAQKHLGIEKIPTEDLIGKGKNQLSMLDVDTQKVSEYACEDADVTWQLHELFAPSIKKQKLTNLYENTELPLIEVLGDMEQRGIKLEAKKLDSISKGITKRLDKLRKEVYEEAGEEFNIGSPKQLGPILFEKLRIQDAVGMKRVKKTKTGYSTDQETLEKYTRHPIAALILEYRMLSKLQSTYVEALPSLIHPKTKRVHTSFNQTVAATGRLSSSHPNLQNIPIRSDLGLEIRKAFVPGEPGWKLISADYSQVELRILAHLSKDKTLIDTFKKDEDVHRRTAALIFGIEDQNVDKNLRSRAKAINFGVIYGMGPQRLARETGISMNEAKDFIAAYFDKYSSVKEYLESQVEYAQKHGYVRTILGRRRLIPDIDSSNPRLAANAERIATNTPIQGSAADLIKVAMVHIDHELKKKKLKTRMLLQVHDELVFEAPESELKTASEIIESGMKNAIPLDVPIKVDLGVGANWAEAH